MRSMPGESWLAGLLEIVNDAYAPPARGPLIHLWFLALRPVQGSNVVGSQPVGARFKQQSEH